MIITQYLVTDRYDIDNDGPIFDTLNQATAAAWNGSKIIRVTYDTSGCYSEGDIGELVSMEEVKA